MTTVVNFAACLCFKMFKPMELAPATQEEQRRTRKEDNIRCRVLNSLIHKALADMMTTCEISQELYDLKLDICKASAQAAGDAEPLPLCRGTPRSSPGCCDVCWRSLLQGSGFTLHTRRTLPLLYLA